MKKNLKYFCLLILMAGFTACEKEKALVPSEEALFPPREKMEIDKELAKIYAPYNTIVEYRYIKNFLPNDWYYITPVKGNLALPMGEFLKKMWIEPLEAGSSQRFVQSNFPKMIILVGSPALQKDGTEVLGQAEGGTLIRFTRVNNFDLQNRRWKQLQLETAFHEYAHLLHQSYNLPEAFRKVTPDNYTKNGWRPLKQQQAIMRGMVSPYGTSAFAEDFAELFAFCITKTDAELAYLFNDQEVTSMEIAEMNKGRGFLRTKQNILVKFLEGIGMDIVKIREDLQAKLNE